MRIDKGWLWCTSCVVAALALIGDHIKSNSAKPDLYAAILTRHPEQVQKAIDEGVDPNLASNSYFGPPLLDAVAKGPPDSVRILLAAGASVNVRGPGKLAPAMAIATSENASEPEMRAILGLLKRKGESLEEVDGGGFTALLLAVRVRDKNAVRALLEAGADIRAKNARGQDVWYWERVSRGHTHDGLAAVLKEYRAKSAPSAGRPHR